MAHRQCKIARRGTSCSSWCFFFARRCFLLPRWTRWICGLRGTRWCRSGASSAIVHINNVVPINVDGLDTPVSPIAPSWSWSQRTRSALCCGSLSSKRRRASATRSSSTRVFLRNHHRGGGPTPMPCSTISWRRSRTRRISGSSRLPLMSLTTMPSPRISRRTVMATKRMWTMARKHHWWKYHRG